ncbi:Crossover junction endonuclease mus81 [Perkinsus olseni]|uniref:Crossover junction endonuclease MUS81 n=1 Tax=Perkinsus olseni TaxID=32597 RepID=A0A7J6RET3_PEROL|nr:Crossover junction endonuclease mus81 [Perkinsus olseni]
MRQLKLVGRFLLWAATSARSDNSDEALNEAPEYGTSEIIYGDYQITGRASGEKKTAEAIGGATEDLEEMRYQSGGHVQDEELAWYQAELERAEKLYRTAGDLVESVQELLQLIDEKATGEENHSPLDPRTSPSSSSPDVVAGRECSSPEDRLVAALPRTVEECERFFNEDPAFVPGKTLFIHHDAIETKREKAIRLCQAGLRGMAIDGDYRVYMNYHINRGIAVASAASMGADRADSQEHTLVWTFDMPEAPLDEDGQAELVIELKLLRSGRPSADHFPTIISIAETFGHIARDPTSRRSPNWSPQSLLDFFDPHLDVLRLAFSDKHGQNVGVANSLSDMPSVVRRAIHRLFGSQHPVVLRPAGRPAGLIGGEFFFGVLEMDAHQVDDSDGNFVKMALLVYGRESHVVEMNFFQQQDACSAQNVHLDSLPDYKTTAESLASLVRRRYITTESAAEASYTGSCSVSYQAIFVITLFIFSIITAITTPQAFIETVVEPLVLAHAILAPGPLMRTPQSASCRACSVDEAEQLDGVGSTFAQVFVQLLTEKEASDSPRRSSLTWRDTLKNRAEKFQRSAPTAAFAVPEDGEVVTTAPKQRQREYRPATGSIQWCILLSLQLSQNGLTAESLGTLNRKQLSACCSSIQDVVRSFSSVDREVSASPASLTVSTASLRSLEKRGLISVLEAPNEKEYCLTQAGEVLGQRILASVEFPLAALSSIQCSTTGSESTQTRKRRRLSYTGAPVPENELAQYRYAGSQPLAILVEPQPSPAIPGPWEAVLLVDVRESALMKELSALGIRAEARSLPITDFLWLMRRSTDGKEVVLGVGGERKTWQDLSASIIDGRYDEQKYRLASKAIALRRIFYLLEGDVERSHGHARTLPSATLRTALCHTRIIGGFGVVNTPSVRHSAKLLAAMHNVIARQKPVDEDKSTTYDAFASSCAKTVGATVRDLTGAMLRQVPGCGAEATKALLEITEKRMDNVTMKSISSLLQSMDDVSLIQAAKAASSSNRSPITQKLLDRLRVVFISG